jgi:hypothetical protein
VAHGGQRRRTDQAGSQPEAHPEGRGNTAGRSPGPAAAAAADPGRPDRDRRQAAARAAGLRGVRGVGRVRQGRGDQAAGRAAGPAARPGRPVQRAHLRRETPPLPVAVLAGAAGLGWHGGARPVLVRPGAGGAGREVRHRGAVAARLPGDRGLRADASRRGHDHRQVLDAPVAGRAAQAVQGPGARSAEGLEADRRGLAEPREMAGLRGGRGGDARPDRPRGRTVGTGRGRRQAVGPGKGRRVGRDRHRGGHGRAQYAGPVGARARGGAHWIRAALNRLPPDGVGPVTFSRLGPGVHKPRLPGHVCHEPRTRAPAGPGWSRAGQLDGLEPRVTRLGGRLRRPVPACVPGFPR